MNWNLSDIEKLAARGFKVSINPIPKNRVVIPRQDSKEVVWMGQNIFYWCEQKNLDFQKEYQFSNNGRKWRFDFAIITLKVGIEMEGIFSVKNRHTSFKGYTADAEKYNAASAQGWKVLRYTNLNYQKVLYDLEEIFKDKKR